MEEWTPHEQPLRLPALSYPFTSAANPHGPLVDRQNQAWVLRFGLLAEGPALARFDCCRYAELTALAYPHCDQDALALVTNFLTLLFLWDDRLDAGEDLEEADTVIAEQLRIWQGTPPARQATPEKSPLASSLLQAARDLQQRVAERMTPVAYQRFVATMTSFYVAQRWQARNRRLGMWPTLFDYAANRLDAGAVYPAFHLAYMAAGIDLPPTIAQHSVLRDLERSANRLICLANDIISFPREMELGEVHNQVILTARERGIPIQAALDLVKGEHDAELAHYLDVTGHLPSFGPAADPVVARAEAALRAWISANLQWSLLTGRYQPQRSEQPTVPGMVP